MLMAFQWWVTVVSAEGGALLGEGHGIVHIIGGGGWCSGREEEGGVSTVCCGED
jgi:hypothetical protein